MPRDFVKRPDREFAAQVAQFLARLASVKDELGLPDDWEAQLLAGHSAFVAALEAVDRARASLHSAVQAKDALREQVEHEWRGLVRQLRAHPDFGDAHAASLGLPVRDRVRTPIEPGAEVPTLEIQIQPLRHAVYFWQADAEGGRRGKPGWAEAVRLVYAVVSPGEPPPPAEQMHYLASATASPFIWELPSAWVGKDIWYRGAWETPRRARGAWSDPARATVAG
jgi:hypothetical protein